MSGKDELPPGTDLVRLEHERRVHNPQTIGALSLGLIGLAAVIVIAVIATKHSPSSTALSALSSIAAAAVGGIAGMLTGAKQSPAAASPTDTRNDQHSQPERPAPRLPNDAQQTQPPTTQPPRS